jgi:hypothetical protein
MTSCNILRLNLITLSAQLNVDVAIYITVTSET